jgi:hypothetical protein
MSIAEDYGSGHDWVNDEKALGGRVVDLRKLRCGCIRGVKNCRHHGGHRRGESMMVNQLKNFQVDRLDMDELFALSALGKQLQAEYATRQMSAPAWLTDQLGVLEREITMRRKDDLEKKLREVKAQRTGLETASEKRERLDREQTELEKQLGITPVTA